MIKNVSFEVNPMVIERKKTRIQDNGQRTASNNGRREPATKRSESVARTEASGSAVSASDKERALRALDEMGEALREQGLTLEDMIERGREIRGQLIEEIYGIKADQDTT
jgi:hypothetical protein